MIRKTVIIIVLTLILFILILNLPIVSIGHKSSDSDYTNWMTETLDNRVRVVDEFSSLVDAMPIVMLDYCNGNDNSFLDNLMTVLIEKNSGNIDIGL